MLLECDQDGHIVWMSERTREVLGNPSGLAAALAFQAQEHPVLHFWRVLDLRGTLLIGAQAQAYGPRGQSQASDMNGLETHFLTHFFRLQRLERSLWARAQSRRKLGRGQIVRQLERERTRISQELHTGVGQMLAAIRLQLELAAANLPDPAEGVRRSLEHIGALVAGVLEQVRAISKRLHPPEWQRLKLETALEQLWELSGMERSFEGAIRLEPLPAELAQEIKTLLYRAAQEAISNVMRHSRATRVQMTLQASDGDAVLTVEDNGKGFDAEAQLSAPPSIASGIGLRSIREQAEALRGKLEIRSSDSGTTLEIRAPLAAMER